MQSENFKLFILYFREGEAAFRSLAVVKFIKPFNDASVKRRFPK